MPAVTMLTLLLLLADMAVGSTSIPLKELWRSLTGNGSDESIRYIILNFRIPKAVTALLSGAALSAVGLQMQTLFRNPLAGPYVLGVSSGASLGVALFTLGMPLLGISASSVWWGGIGAVEPHGREPPSSCWSSWPSPPASRTSWRYSSWA